MDESQEDASQAPSSSIFIPPSIHKDALLSGASYTHFSPVPPSLNATPATSTSTSEQPAESDKPSSGVPCFLGVDEAGRGPVLGPMVYGVFYLPVPLSDALLRDTHHFDDSKVLSAAVRSDLMAKLCDSGSDLHTSCGWATSALSARDIGANMMRPHASYNLNAQAMDATVDLIRGVIARGVNIEHIYVDTIGQPAAYQAKLQRLFPNTKITVAKKADSLYPCVSAASVCAKVTRDAALEVLYAAQNENALLEKGEAGNGEPGMAWGSGYPSDARCVNWMKTNMHPIFGWGAECRFSWGTAKDMLDSRGVKVDWPAQDDEEGDSMRLTDFYGVGDGSNGTKGTAELASWFGTSAPTSAF